MYTCQMGYIRNTITYVCYAADCKLQDTGRVSDQLMSTNTATRAAARCTKALCIGSIFTNVFVKHELTLRTGTSRICGARARTSMACSRSPFCKHSAQAAGQRTSLCTRLESSALSCPPRSASLAGGHGVRVTSALHYTLLLTGSSKDVGSRCSQSSRALPPYSLQCGDSAPGIYFSSPVSQPVQWSARGML
jgi:hypothetical protein